MTGCASEILKFVLNECVSVHRHFFVAFYAGQVRMCSRKREIRSLVIELCRRPVVECVAALAVRVSAARSLDGKLSKMHVSVACLTMRVERTKD